MGIEKESRPVVNAEDVVARLARWVGVDRSGPKWRRRRDPAGMARRAVLVCLALREGVGVNQLARTTGIHKETVILIGRRFTDGSREESTLASMLSQGADPLTDVEAVNWDAKLSEPAPKPAPKPAAAPKAARSAVVARKRTGKVKPKPKSKEARRRGWSAPVVEPKKKKPARSGRSRSRADRAGAKAAPGRRRR